MTEYLTSQHPVLNLGQSVALGYDSTARPVTISGYNSSITGVNLETVWSTGGAYAFPTTTGGYPKTVEIDSSSANDAAGGSGAKTVRIEYLDSSFNLLTSTQSPVGTTDTDLVLPLFYRLNGITVMTGAAAAGVIQVREIDDSPIFGAVEVGQYRSRDAVYTVPLGKKFLVESLSVTSNAATADKSYGLFTVMANYDQYLCAKQTFDVAQFSLPCNAGGAYMQPAAPICFPAGVDIHIDVIGNAVTDAAEVTAELRGMLLPA